MQIVEKYILITHWFSRDLFHVTQWSQISMYVGRPTNRYALYHQAGKIEIKNTCNVLSIIYVTLYYGRIMSIYYTICVVLIFKALVHLDE